MVRLLSSRIRYSVEDPGQNNGTPVADELVGAGVHAHARLAREEEQDQHGEEDHVRGQGGEHKEADAVQQFAGPRRSLFHSSSPPPPPPPVGRRSTGGLPPIPGFFPFDLRGGGRKDGGHARGPL
jgi:hypothetical protein